jgi:hypothetical protein
VKATAPKVLPVRNSQAEDDRLSARAHQLGVEHAEDEGRQRERRKAEGARIRDRCRDELHALRPGGRVAGPLEAAFVGLCMRFHEVSSSWSRC